MPVVLPSEDEEFWLDKEANPKKLMHILRPYEAEKTDTWKVSKAVGNFRNDGPELIKKIG